VNSLYLKLAKVKSSKKLRKFIQILRNIFGEENPGTINFDFEKKPSRLFIIQEIINKKKFRSYLEIGTFKNEVFSNIVCEKKIGVDPFSGGTHRMTSDEFFSKYENKFDCIFIDGLHHYDQVIKDINNSLKRINENGIILLHDCLPKNMDAQAIPRTVVEWNGDVWKALVNMRTKKNLDCYTCYADHGLGIILKRPNRNLLNLKVSNFKKLKYVDFYNDYKNLMNLIEYDQLKNLI